MPDEDNEARANSVQGSFAMCHCKLNQAILTGGCRTTCDAFVLTKATKGSLFVGDSHAKVSVDKATPLRVWSC